MKWVYFIVLLLGTASLLEAQPIRIATYRYADNDRIGNIKPLASYISIETGREVAVSSYPSVPEFISAITEGKVDIALINTFGYLLLKSSGRPVLMEPAVSLVVPAGDASNYRTVFLARSGTQFSNLQDIISHASRLRLALVAPGSTSGNLVPRLALANLGMAWPEDAFDTVFYAGTHAAAIEALLKNEADIAAMGQDAWSETTTQLRRIWLSPEIPLGPVLINRQLPVEIRQKITSCLLHIHEKEPAALASLKGGWTEARHATHFMVINDNHYKPFLSGFGQSEAITEILRRFAQ